MPWLIQKLIFTSRRGAFSNPLRAKALKIKRNIRKEFSESLRPIFSEKNGMVLSGLMGKPGESRSTRKEMIYFVNQRPVDSKT